jgi:tRNA (guanine-N7-)-methyltransferase
MLTYNIQGVFYVRGSDINGTGDFRNMKTFGRKAVKLSKSQKEMIETFLPEVSIPFKQGIEDIANYFSATGPLHLEIGFGMGEYTLGLAAACPDHRIIGCEIFKNGIASLLKGIKERDIGNIRIIHGDAKIALQEMFDPDTFDFIHINHPDPWPKKRHHKRRIIQPGTLGLFAGALKKEGEIWLSTDVAEYAEWMVECFDDSPLFEKVIVERRFLDDIIGEKLATKYENKGIKNGRATRHLRYRRRV